MRSRPYPLEAARQLRTQAQDAAVDALARARADLADAEAAQQRAAAAVDAVIKQRAQSHGSAAISGSDLARAGAYDIRLRAAQQDKEAELKLAAAKVKRCRRAERLAELALHQAYVEREVIERHHARFAEVERKRAARAADDEEDDLQAARRAKGPIW